MTTIVVEVLIADIIMREAEAAATDIPWRMKLALARHSISHRIHILDIIM